MSTIQVRESPQEMRPDEAIAWALTLDSTSYPSPASAVSTLYDITTDTETDVSSTKLTGSASIAGTTFTSKRVTGLVAGHVYRLEFQFVSSGNTFEPFLIIKCVA